MKKDNYSFLQCIFKCADEINESGHYALALNYRKAGRSLARFLKEHNRNDLSLKEMTPALVGSYNSWLEQTGAARNSVSFYNRQLRAIYNRAVKNKYVKDCRPFADVYTGVAKTGKRAVSLKDISLVCSALDGTVSMARDMFEFSFNACGMTFVDMVYLKKRDIQDDTLTYYRRKTGSRIMVPLSARAQKIIKKYGSQTDGSPYVFPILGEETGEKAYKRYLSALTAYNQALKKLGKAAHMHKGAKLTSYVSRHSWATAARNAGAPIAVISTALGHSSEKTTQIYLDSFEISKIAAVNSKILHGIQRA